MKKVVFIVPQLSQPRVIKRIESISRSGVGVKIYGFDNGLYKCNIDHLPFVVHEIIPRLKEASRIAKMLFFIKTIRRIMRENRNDTIFYFFGYEIGALAYLLGCRKYVYEEADVSAARVKNGLLHRLMLSLDRRVIHRALLTVFTSGGFVDYIFANKVKPDNIILMPNKLSPYFDKKKKNLVNNKAIDYSKLKFGFIGLIRYPNTIIRFAKVVGKYFPQHEFHFYGDVERKEYLDGEVLSCQNVFFHGAFSNPTDLQKIYSEIDVNVVCYDTRSGNVQIAEPNKLYESIFFETPIVVSNNTYLARRVADLKVGSSMDASTNESIIAYIESLYDGYYDEILSRMKDVEIKTLIDNPDELISCIKQYIC